MVVYVFISGAPGLTSADLAKTSWLSWFGGLFGAVYVVAAILLLPRLVGCALLVLGVVPIRA